MKNKILWLFATNFGRYALGILLLLTGIFSENGVLGFLTPEWMMFDYLMSAGVVIIVLQFIYHIVSAIYLNITKEK